MEVLHMAYYDILEVPKKASQELIQKAFMQPSLRWYPEKFSEKEIAEWKFKEIAEAYKVLSDKSKHEIYDFHGKGGLMGADGPSTSRGVQGVPEYTLKFRSACNIFLEFFGGEDPFANLLPRIRVPFEKCLRLILQSKQIRW